MRCYARYSARTFTHYGNGYVPDASKRIPDEVVLEKPQLPSHAEWVSALDLAGRLFGVTLAGKALHADNLKRFEGLVTEKVREVATAAERLPGALASWRELFGVDADADRLRTARSAAELCAALSGQPALRLVAVLAAYTPATSAQAVARSLAAGRAVREVLADRLTLGQFEALAQRRNSLEGAAELIERVGRRDLATGRGECLAGQSGSARRGGGAGTDGPAWPGPGRAPGPGPGPGPMPPERGREVVLTRQVSSKGRQRALRELDTAMAEARAAIERAGDDVEVSATIQVTGRKGDG